MKADNNQECYMNRELSWLKFNERVLNEAGNERVPLAERLTFLSIYQTNLDEFFRVRVGTLMRQDKSGKVIRDNKTNMTSREQIDAILENARNLDIKKQSIYDQVMGELEPHGVRIINFNRLSNSEKSGLKKYFVSQIQPYLSPMLIMKGHQFPFLNNGDIYAFVVLKSKSGKLEGIVPTANKVFSRMIEVPTRPGTFILTEEMILHFITLLYPDFTVEEKSLIRVTRNADIDASDLYDEDMDFRDAMETLVKERKFLDTVRLEISRRLSDDAIDSLKKNLDIKKKQIFLSLVPLDLSFVFGIQKYLEGNEGLFYPKRTPRMSRRLDIKKSLLDQVEQKDVLLSYPFESMRPFLRLLQEAADDPTVTSIRMTLYRLADRSKVVESLVEAAENGKEVTVMVELRARFDEAHNIEMSHVLEDAGCHVIYGLEKYKVHSKLCLITRKKEKGIEYITQVGTGNYNEKTAKLYTDLCLITANQAIGHEASQVFDALLKGETIKKTETLLVSPNCLQNKVLEKMDTEIAHAKAGEPAYLGFKMNSLTDKDIIDKLIEASEAGVRIEMIIRGICCLVPGIPGKTDNITVISIVGRFLEHSRIYRFGTKDREEVYISSADFMTRNTLKRVEVAAPILDPALRDRIDDMFDTMMRDDEKGKILRNDGTYADRNTDGPLLNSQELFYAEAYSREEKPLPGAGQATEKK
ncbi:MAG: polyphosphate kinase 1 [Eubacteriales bacterium]